MGQGYSDLRKCDPCTYSSSKYGLYYVSNEMYNVALGDVPWQPCQHSPRPDINSKRHLISASLRRASGSANLRWMVCLRLRTSGDSQWRELEICSGECRVRPSTS